jgi:4-alpha-glucanotransferase
LWRELGSTQFPNRTHLTRVKLPRSSGILLHITSLPSAFGIGDLGLEAYHFVDRLVDAGQTVWQMLPLGPTAKGNSPYSLYSAFAGNPLLISPELLLGDGLLSDADVSGFRARAEDTVDYEAVAEWKDNILSIAFQKFKGGSDGQIAGEFTRFKEEEALWLDDYTLFMALKERFPESESWSDWDSAIALREPSTLQDWRTELSPRTEEHAFRQFLFFKQWRALRRYCVEHNVRLMGDIPIYVSHDSADVWAHRENFELDEQGRPTYVAGVPPDYFSETGQLWGNPIYRWSHLAQEGYRWWIDRFRSTHESFDIIRLDHFRGFEAYWQVPSSEKTAIKGEWVKAPGSDFFRTLISCLGELNIVVENLGLITPDVEALRREFEFPGMAVLQFGFTDDEASGSSFQPHNFERNLVAYTGTHDNDTTVGWWKSFEKAGDSGSGAVSRGQQRVLRYFDAADKDITWTLIRAVEASVAQVVIVPMQDILGLGSEARMNTPATAEHNWRWRMKAGAFTPALASRLREYVDLYERNGTVSKQE